jgi:hypothetical protein
MGNRMSNLWTLGFLAAGAASSTQLYFDHVNNYSLSYGH